MPGRQVVSAEAKKKERFEIGRAVRLLRKAVAGFPKAAMFELAERGHGTLFEQVVACILSIRTFDEVSLPAALRLFQAARTPEKLAGMTVEAIDALIRPCTFHWGKAEQVRAIAKRVVEEFGGGGGKLPCDRELLLSLKGVGPKCANLAIGIACGEAWISVDVHVHRVVNRWGWLEFQKTTEGMLAALEGALPKRYWTELNSLLVPFGKHVCTGKLPKCSMCPLLSMCRQVGVERHL
jgi:endonuclease-3